MGSDQDGEVLAAARRANAIVKAAGLTWSEVLGGGSSKTPAVPWNKDFSATPAPPSQESVATATAARVKAIMDNLKNRNLGSFQDTFDGLYMSWRQSGYLNPLQRAVLYGIERDSVSYTHLTLPTKRIV